MRRLAILAALIFAAGAGAAEQAKPSFDCAKARSPAESGCLRTQAQIAESGRDPRAGETQPAPRGADQTVSSPTEADGVLRPVGLAGKFSTWRQDVFGNRLVFSRFDTSGNAKEIVSIDPATGGATVVASHLHEPTVLSSDSSLTVVVDPYLEGGIEVAVFDSRTGTERNRLKIERVPTASAVVGQELRLASTSEQYPPRLAVDIIDLSNNTQVASHELWNVPSNGRAIFWNGKIVLVSPGVITLYNEHLDKLASAPAPSNDIYARSFCGVHEPRSFGSLLIYQISCGRIVVFDLDRLAVVRIFERFDPSRFLSIDVENDLLFAAPTEDERKPRNGAVFDLTTGRRVAVLPVTADAIAIRGDFLAALAPRDEMDPNAPRAVSLYHVDRTELSDVAQERALEEGHAKALGVLARSGSFDDAIDTLESAAVTDRLFDIEAPGQKLREIALDYGTWLSATLDRRAAGIKLVDRLVAAAPDDLVAKRRLGAALMRDYLLTGSQASLDHAQGLLADRPDLLAARTASNPTARSTPIDFGAFPNRIAFWRDKVVVGGRRDKLATLGVYDRATLQPLWSHDIPHPSAQQDEDVEGLTFADDRVFAWLGARVAVVDMASRAMTVRSLRAAYYDIVLQTPVGVLGCEAIALGRCALIDPKTQRTTERFDCNPMQLAGRDAADQQTLGTLVAPRCQVDMRGQLIALGKHWMMTQNGSWPGPYALKYRRVQKGAEWRSSELSLLRESNARIIDARDGAIIDNPRPASHQLIGLDLKTGAYSTLLQLNDPDEAGIAWAIADQILMVGAGHDVILYHLANHHMAGALRNVTAEELEDNGHGVDNAKIVRLLVDGPRIIVLTFDGKYSRTLQTKDVLSYAEQTVQPFSLLEEELRK